jgi:hypothetical protein
VKEDKEKEKDHTAEEHLILPGQPIEEPHDEHEQSHQIVQQLAHEPERTFGDSRLEKAEDRKEEPHSAIQNSRAITPKVKLEAQMEAPTEVQIDKNVLPGTSPSPAASASEPVASVPTAVVESSSLLKAAPVAGLDAEAEGQSSSEEPIIAETAAAETHEARSPVSESTAEVPNSPEMFVDALQSPSDVATSVVVAPTQIVNADQGLEGLDSSGVDSDDESLRGVLFSEVADHLDPTSPSQNEEHDGDDERDDRPEQDDEEEEPDERSERVEGSTQTEASTQAAGSEREDGFVQFMRRMREMLNSTPIRDEASAANEVGSTSAASGSTSMTPTDSVTASSAAAAEPSAPSSTRTQDSNGTDARPTNRGPGIEVTVIELTAEQVDSNRSSNGAQDSQEEDGPEMLEPLLGPSNRDLRSPGTDAANNTSSNTNDGSNNNINNNNINNNGRRPRTMQILVIGGTAPPGTPAGARMPSMFIIGGGPLLGSIPGGAGNRPAAASMGANANGTASTAEPEQQGQQSTPNQPQQQQPGATQENTRRAGLGGVQGNIGQVLLAALVASMLNTRSPPGAGDTTTEGTQTGSRTGSEESAADSSDFPGLYSSSSEDDLSTSAANAMERQPDGSNDFDGAYENTAGGTQTQDSRTGTGASDEWESASSDDTPRSTNRRRAQRGQRQQRQGQRQRQQQRRGDGDGSAGDILNTLLATLLARVLHDSMQGNNGGNTASATGAGGAGDGNPGANTGTRPGMGGGFGFLSGGGLFQIISGGDLFGGGGVGGGQGGDYEALLRLAELLGPARPRHAQREDVEEQLPVVTWTSAEAQEVTEAFVDKQQVDTVLQTKVDDVSEPVPMDLDYEPLASESHGSTSAEQISADQVVPTSDSASVAPVAERMDIEENENAVAPAAEVSSPSAATSPSSSVEPSNASLPPSSSNNQDASPTTGTSDETQPVAEDDASIPLVSPWKVKDILSSTKEKCTICLMPYDDGDNLRILRCKHGFHVECIDQWLTGHVNSCPICRAPGTRSNGNTSNQRTGTCLLVFVSG